MKPMTMNDLYGKVNDDSEGYHEVCPKCGWCLVCDSCMCDYLAQNPDMEAMRFPYKRERGD
jgi:hypothetical protein